MRGECCWGMLWSVHMSSSRDVPAALVFVYDYHAGADTLLSRHFPASVAEGLHGPAVPVPEDVLWRYLLQLSSALTAVHDSGLAARFIHASKILVVGDHRQVQQCVCVCVCLCGHACMCVSVSASVSASASASVSVSVSASVSVSMSVSMSAYVCSLIVR